MKTIKEKYVSPEIKVTIVDEDIITFSETEEFTYPELDELDVEEMDG